MATLRSIIVLTAMCSLGAACASAPPAGESTANAPEIEIAQQDTTTDTLFFRGPVPLTYVLTVHNPLEVPVTLERVELQTQGRGAYRLQAEALGLEKQIAPGATESIGLQTWGRSANGFLTRHAPVSLVGRAYFDSSQGRLFRFFTAHLPQ